MLSGSRKGPLSLMKIIVQRGISEFPHFPYQEHLPRGALHVNTSSIPLTLVNQTWFGCPFLQGSDSSAREMLTSIVYSLGAEYRFCDSSERLRTHLAAVYVSNFFNYLTGLAFEISRPNQTLLLPLAIETVRKAFLYEDPFAVQTGPAKRGDYETIRKHLEILKDYPEQEHIYQELTNLILKRSGFDKLN